MNRKQFGILVVLLVVLGGAGWLVEQGRDRASSAGESGAGNLLLGGNFPVNDVALISIKQGTNEVSLVKKDDRWRVRERDEYPAAFAQISELGNKLAELKVIQSEQVSPSQLARMGLAAPGQGTNSGTLLDLKDKDGKSIRSLILGMKHEQKAPQGSPMGGGYPDGRYVTVAGGQNALLVADPLMSVEPKPDQWLNKDFFHVERPKAVAVTFPEATNSWKIARDTDTGEWKFADAKPDEKLDSTKASGTTTAFASPSFNDVAPLSAKPETLGLDKPTVVVIDTFDDFTYTVSVGKKSGDEYPITVKVAANFPKERTPEKDEKPEDKTKADKAYADRQKQLEDTLKAAKAFEKWTYLVPSYVADPVLKERKDLLPDKKDDKAGDAAKPGDAPAGLDSILGGQNGLPPGLNLGAPPEAK